MQGSALRLSLPGCLTLHHFCASFLLVSNFILPHRQNLCLVRLTPQPVTRLRSIHSPSRNPHTHCRTPAGLKNAILTPLCSDLTVLPTSIGKMESGRSSLAHLVPFARAQEDEPLPAKAVSPAAPTGWRTWRPIAVGVALLVVLTVPLALVLQTSYFRQ